MTTVPTFDTLGLEVDDQIATLTLRSDGRMNIMDLVMRKELAVCFDYIRADSDARVVIITGAGESFCVGGNAREFIGTSAEDLHDLMRKHSHRWFQNLWNLPQPTIAAVNGVAAGGGANLMLATDLAVASTNASFGQTFVKVGLMPDLGGLYLLPRLVGMRLAKELSFTGRMLDANELLEHGIVNKVVAPEELMTATSELALTIARQPRHTIAATKSVLNRATEQSLEEVLLNELMAQSFLFGTTGHKDALDAFFNKNASGKEGKA